MNIHDKHLLKLFDVDSYLVDSFSVSNTSTQYFIYFKFKPIIQYCPHCGSVHFHIKGNYIRTLCHPPINNLICKVKTSFKRYLCLDCHTSFTEVNPIAYKGKSFTKLAIVCILQDLNPYNSTYSHVARKYGISVMKVIDLFDSFVQIERKRLPRVLLIDEFYFGRHSEYKYPAILMNFENNLIIDIVKSRTHEIFGNYLFSIPLEEREMVQFICTDMSFTFKPLLHTFFKNATLLVDHFHVTKLVNDQLNNTRKRIMRKYEHHKNSLEYRLLKHRYKLLLKSKDNINIEFFSKDRILNYTTTENGVLEELLNIDKELREAYKIKEEYLSFDQCKKEDINNCDEAFELDSLIKRCELSQI